MRTPYIVIYKGKDHSASSYIILRQLNKIHIIRQHTSFVNTQKRNKLHKIYKHIVKLPQIHNVIEREKKQSSTSSPDALH